jgi:hypothetical protein
MHAYVKWCVYVCIELFATSETFSLSNGMIEVVRLQKSLHQVIFLSSQ